MDEPIKTSLIFVNYLTIAKDPEMAVRIISREIIKPSSSTPNHLKIHKLSLMDQMASYSYLPILLFYSGPCKNSDHLKKSLSQILTHYYTFAGQVKDHSFIECNDYGVSFIEAHVATKMSEVLHQQPQLDLLEKLLPCQSTTLNVVVLQSHLSLNILLPIETAAAHFVKNWAAVACGGTGNDINKDHDLIFDSTSILPPIDCLGSSSTTKEMPKPISIETTTKRFIFDGSKIAALQDKIGNRPTRFEAVSALLWGTAVRDAQREEEEDGFTTTTTTTQFEALITVNLRKKMNPPIPEQCIGNIHTWKTTDWPMEETINYSSLARKLHESVNMINDEYVRKGNASDSIFSCIGNFLEKDIKLKPFFITSWCRLPFYKADFGWGKPILLTTTMRFDKGAILLDTCDGDGIEAWVTLPKEDMIKFQKHPDILG
ncbi:hypothetical protein JRO89_XS10G0098900 [Xanthoceras sorbifolium]|uniref:Uncharacterized protein n=1 Tax=Xanthoceras sorbifolium TaxID=99658 RepID=A0ABQ8HI82_9ROSI|nr:hypothetical protein JRO89_XS10G0098900 [Xanthoceras sorbifolium]